MKKKSIVIFFMALLLAGGVITAIVLINKKKEEERKAEEERLYLEKSTNDINELWKKIDVNIRDNNYVLDLIEGKMFDLSLTSDKEELFEDGEILETIEEGKVFVDANGDIKIISNIKIRELYCTYKEDKFDCNRVNDANTGLENVDNKVYKIGDAVTLKDGSLWHVIGDSSMYSNYVTLLYDGVLKTDKYASRTFNDDYEDGFPFDTSGLRDLDKERSGNIMYYLYNEYLPSLGLGDDAEVRIMYEEEYVKLMEKIDRSSLNEEMLNTEEVKHWFYNHTLGNWWIFSEDEYGLKTVIWSNGFMEGNDGFAISDVQFRYYVRPVITINKNNLSVENE